MENLIVGLMYSFLFFLTLFKLIRGNSRRDFTFSFNVWWLIWLMCSFLNIGKFFKVEGIIYIYILSGIIFFNVPFIISKNKKYKVLYGKVKKVKFFYLTEGIYFLINMYYLFKLSTLINIFSEYSLTRTTFFGIREDGIKLFSSAIFVFIYNFFRSMSIVAFLISLSKVFQKKRRGLFFLSTLNLILFCTISAGRDYIMYILIIGIYAFKIGFLKKSLKHIIFLTIPTLLITFLREGSLKKVFLIIVTYFNGSIVFFNEVYKNTIDKFYYGELFFYFIILPFRYVLYILGLSDNKGAMVEVGEKLMKFIQISSENIYSLEYNALPTAFYMFYRDFRYFGIIIFSLLLGWLGVFLKRKTEDRNPEHIVLIAYFEYMMLMTIFNNKFMDIFSLFPIGVYIFLLSKKRRKV